MSATERVSKTIKDTIRSTQDFVDGAKQSLQAELSRTTPKLEHALDRSLDEAGRTLSNTLKSLDEKTSSEQLELLNGYREFLKGQVDFVDERIRAIKKD